MGAIVFAFSLVVDKAGLATMVKNSVINSFTEKFWGKKKSDSADSSPVQADNKKSTMSLASLVKRRKNSSGGSIKDLGITLDDPPPTEIIRDSPEPHANKNDEKNEKDSTILAEKWESYQNIGLATKNVDESAKGLNKPSRFKFFKKKPERYTDENGEELSNNKTKGKARRKRASSGISQMSSASDLSYKDTLTEVPAIEPAERSVRFDVGSENLEFADYQAKVDPVTDQVD